MTPLNAVQAHCDKIKKNFKNLKNTWLNFAIELIVFVVLEWERDSEKRIEWKREKSSGRQSKNVYSLSLLQNPFTPFNAVQTQYHYK